MDLIEVAESVERWLAEGRQVGVAWPVGLAGFSSRPPGEVVAVTDDGRQAGELVGPEVTAAVAAELSRWLRTGSAGTRLAPFPVDDRAAAGAGLSCGGTLTVALHKGPAVPGAFWQAVRQGRPASMVTWLTDEADPGRVAVGVGTGDGSGDPAGRLGDEEVDRRAADATRGLLAEGGSRGRMVAEGTGWLVVEAVTPTPRLVVVGGGELAGALARQAGLLGWRPQVQTDARAALAAVVGLSPGHGVVVLSHDHDVAIPALSAALAGRASYVGALGSRRTQAARRERLLASGVTEADISTIHGPAGLDLGGRAPAEIALAICAEMLAVRSGRDAGPLRQRAAPING